MTQKEIRSKLQNVVGDAKYGGLTRGVIDGGINSINLSVSNYCRETNNWSLTGTYAHEMYCYVLERLTTHLNEPIKNMLQGIYYDEKTT